MLFWINVWSLSIYWPCLLSLVLTLTHSLPSQVLWTLARHYSDTQFCPVNIQNSLRVSVYFQSYFLTPHPSLSYFCHAHTVKMVLQGNPATNYTTFLNGTVRAISTNANANVTADDCVYMILRSRSRDGRQLFQVLPNSELFRLHPSWRNNLAITSTWISSSYVPFLSLIKGNDYVQPLMNYTCTSTSCHVTRTDFTIQLIFSPSTEISQSTSVFHKNCPYTVPFCFTPYGLIISGLPKPPINPHFCGLHSRLDRNCYLTNSSLYCPDSDIHLHAWDDETTRCGHKSGIVKIAPRNPSLPINYTSLHSSTQIQAQTTFSLLSDSLTNEPVLYEIHPLGSCVLYS